MTINRVHVFCRSISYLPTQTQTCIPCYNYSLRWLSALSSSSPSSSKLINHPLFPCNLSPNYWSSFWGFRWGPDTAVYEEIPEYRYWKSGRYGKSNGHLQCDSKGTGFATLKNSEKEKKIRNAWFCWSWIDHICIHSSG